MEQVRAIRTASAEVAHRHDHELRDVQSVTWATPKAPITGQRHSGSDMMKNALYGGINPAVLTPMRSDLTPDLDKLAARCRWLLANGCNGLAVLGTTGEGNSLGIREKLDLLEGLAERGIPGDKLLPGVGTTAVPDTVTLTRKAAEIGCRGVLVLPPFYYKNPSEDGLFAYFSELINQVGTGTPIYLYHIPAQSAVPFTLSLVSRLLREFPGTIKGIKDSSGDLANTLSYVEHFAKDGFEVYCGDDGALHELLKAGGAGCITGASNLTGAINARVYANVGTPVGDAAQRLLGALRKVIAGAPLISGLKALVARQTGDAAWTNVRSPHVKLSAEAAKTLFMDFDSCMTTAAEAA
jgi:4-hydroxy-tetrahydrodipicolinate synthase